MYYNTGFYGMHFLWWVFWGCLWVALFMFWVPVSRRRFQDFREAPLDILKRRLARGEINEQQYLNLKAHLEGDGKVEPPQTTKRAV